MLKPVDEPLGRSGQGPLPEPSRLLSLREIAAFIQRYRQSIGLCVLVPVLIAALYLAITPRLYKARAQILLQSGTPVPTSEIQLAGVRTLESPEIESQIVLLKSDNIALSVIQSLKLASEKDFARSLTVPPNSPVDAATTRLLLATLAEGLDVRRSGLSYAIDVSFTHRNPELATRIANGVAQALVDDQRETRVEALKVGSAWLEARIESIRKQMNDATLRVQRFKLKRDYRVGEMPPARTLPEASARPVTQLTPQVTGDAKGSAEPTEHDTLDELEARAQTYRQIYQSYLQVYTESVQRQSFPLASARIITPALPPLLPSWPLKTIILAFALVNGVLIGFGQALIRHHIAD